MCALPLGAPTPISHPIYVTTERQPELPVNVFNVAAWSYFLEVFLPYIPFSQNTQAFVHKHIYPSPCMFLLVLSFRVRLYKKKA